MTYSVDFRRHVLKIKEEEALSYTEASLRFRISKASILRWHKELEPKKNRNKPPTKIDMDALKKDILTYPDSYYHERAQRLGISKTGLYWALQRLGVTYKKNPVSSQSRRREAVIVSEQDTTL